MMKDGPTNSKKKQLLMISKCKRHSSHTTSPADEDEDCSSCSQSSHHSCSRDDDEELHTNAALPLPSVVLTAKDLKRLGLTVTTMKKKTTKTKKQRASGSRTITKNKDSSLNRGSSRSRISGISSHSGSSHAAFPVEMAQGEEEDSEEEDDGHHYHSGRSRGSFWSSTKGSSRRGSFWQPTKRRSNNGSGSSRNLGSFSKRLGKSVRHLLFSSKKKKDLNLPADLDMTLNQVFGNLNDTSLHNNRARAEAVRTLTAANQAAADPNTGIGHRAEVLRYRNRMASQQAESTQSLFRISTIGAAAPPPLPLRPLSASILQQQALAMEEEFAVCPDKDNIDTTMEASYRSLNQHSNSLQMIQAASDWHQLIQPFVSDLAFGSIVTRKAESAVCFDPYTCEAAVLFVDLSGYSKITSAISHKGAHAISAVVNVYLDRLLQIIHDYGGDVIKFAGDAVLVVWAGKESTNVKGDGIVDDDDDELEYNLLCASKCALELQRQAGEHPVQGTQHSFKIHCGLCCGMIESEIFAAASHHNMQRLFHSVSGQPLIDISELVDLAKAGEVAISDDVADYLGTRGEFEPIEGVVGGMLLTGIHFDAHLEEAMAQHIQDSKKERQARRIPGSEEEFIHPSVLRLLRYGGLSPTQIAQMRNLCVLFIGMTSNGNSVNWLMEVQAVLDRHRCPIIQIIDDDKGVHVVAAINLCESVPESAVLGLDACRELVRKQIGCAIGMAMGPTFCGVTGSSNIACRWDITGPHPVRAARLMQYALKNKCQVAIDASLLNDSMAASKMTILDSCVEIKGSPEPCVVYGLSGSKIYSVFRLLENTPGPAISKAVNQVRKSINTGRTRCAVILTGAPFSGKKEVCQKAAALSDLVPFMHVCCETAGLAQLARTIATWYSFVKRKGIRTKAQAVLEHMDQEKWSKAHDECVDLVATAVEEGYRACFVIDRIQFLDSFSLSILRGCLEGKSRSERTTCIRRVDLSDDELSYSESESGMLRSKKHGFRKGKVVFLGCHLSLYNLKSANEIKEDITRACKSFRVKVVLVEESTEEELKSIIVEKFDLEPDKRWLRCHKEASGGSLSYLLERARALRKLTSNPSCCGADQNARDMVTSTLRLHIPSGSIQSCHELPLSRLTASLAMKTLQLYDDLPPLYQTLTKVLAIATRQPCFKIPSTVLWKVMNDLYGDIESSRFATVIQEMKDMYLLRITIDGNMDKVSFESPIITKVVLTVCTPTQIHIISEALLYRLEAIKNHNFKVPLVIADLLRGMGTRESRMKKCWKRAYESFLEVAEQDASFGGEDERQWWMEYFSDVITMAGFSPTDVLGSEFKVQATKEEPLPPRMLRLKSFVPPISLGPLAHTLSAMGRALFRDFGAHISGDYDLKTQNQIEISAATTRYLREIEIMESLLAMSGLEATKDQLNEERTLVNYLASTSSSAEEVALKSESYQTKLVREHVHNRLERIRDFVSCLQEVPDVITNCNDNAIKEAYVKSRHDKCWKDRFEDSLMAMAAMNWKPRNVPECECLPITCLQTICNIRDQFFGGTAASSREDNEDGDMIDALLPHHYVFADFQAFLIMTALIYNAMDTHGGDLTRPKIRRRPSESDLGDVLEESMEDIGATENETGETPHARSAPGDEADPSDCVDVDVDDVSCLSFQME